MTESFSGGTEEREEIKKTCRVCKRRVYGQYKKSGGRRCVVCLHRTHRDHLAGNRRSCQLCAKEDLTIHEEYRQVPNIITLVHLTDLHFGANDSPKRTELLKEWIGSRGEQYILISGDLTRMARREEYDKAALWIHEVESTGAKVAVVPGNHDISYWENASSLMGQVLGRKYQSWTKKIDRPIEPCLRGPGCVILGLNSAHGLNPARLLNGYLDRHQRARAIEILKATPKEHVKIVFCHHPMVRFADNRHRDMFRSGMVRGELISAGANLFLWGHQHSFASVMLTGSGRDCYAIQGPTLSDRTGEGGMPGFLMVQWIYNQRVTIQSYDIVEDQYIEENQTIEYPLKEEDFGSLLN